MSEEATPLPPVHEATVEDVRRVQTQALTLLTLARETPREDLEALGISPEQVREVAAAIRKSTATVPSAKAMLLASMSEALSPAVVRSAYQRTLVALHSLAPLIALRLAAKIDDYDAPGSTKVLLELAKGLGLLTPAAPVSGSGRMALLDLEELRRRSPDELKDEILRHST